MDKWDIKELDCSKMCIHPYNAQLVKFFEKNMPNIKGMDFGYMEGSFTKSMVLRYILLTYDKESPIQKMHSLDFYEKKFHACAYSGFKLKKGKDGYRRFDERVLDMILGKNEGVVDMIVEFIAFQNNPQWSYLVFLHESMLAFTRDAIGKKNRDARTSKEFRALYDDYYKISNEIGHTYEETEEFVSRFYYQIEQSRLSVRPEDYSKIFDDDDAFRADNPYGIGYNVEEIKFLGDDEEQVRERLSRS